MFGVAVYVFSFWWFDAAILGLILGISFFVTIIIAVTVAMLLPWIFYKLEYDPAVASGPFATVIRDITGIIVYFTVASIVLERFAS